MKKTVLGIVLSTFALIGAVPRDASASSFTITTGGATSCAAGPALPCTMTSTDSTFSVLRLVLDTPTLFSDITNLTTNYTANLGGIGGGSPRWAFVTDTNQSFLLHWGPAGSFTDPTLGAGSTGNLLALTDVGRYDLGGIGGSGYTDRTAALTLAGGMTITRISLLVDSFGGNDRSFTFGDRAFTVDSNEGAVATPEPGSMLLLGTGVLGLLFGRSRMTKTAKA